MNDLHKTLYVENFKSILKQSTLGTAAANRTLKFGGPRPGYVWFVERVALYASVSPTVGAYVFCRDDSAGVDYTDIRDFSSDIRTFPGDAADEFQPIFVNQGEDVQVRFEGVTLDALYAANIQISVRTAVRVVLPDQLDLTNPDMIKLVGAFTA